MIVAFILARGPAREPGGRACQSNRRWPAAASRSNNRSVDSKPYARTVARLLVRSRDCPSSQSCSKPIASALHQNAATEQLSSERREHLSQMSEMPDEGRTVRPAMSRIQSIARCNFGRRHPVHSVAPSHKSNHRPLFPLQRAANFCCNAGRTLRASTDHSGHDQIEHHIVHGTCMVALGLKPRRQIRQPLRGGINEPGFQVLVETSEDKSTDKNEKHAKRHLHGMAYRQDLLAPALQSFARQKPDDQ